MTKMNSFRVSKLHLVTFRVTRGSIISAAESLKSRVERIVENTMFCSLRSFID